MLSWLQIMKQGHGCQVKIIAACGVDFKVHCRTIYHLHRSSVQLQSAYQGTISSPFAATKKGFQLVEVCS